MSQPTASFDRKKEKPQSKAPLVILSIAVAVVLVIAAVAAAVHYLAVRIPSELAHNTKEEAFDAAHRMAEGFKKTFNFTPQITVNGVTVIEQAESVMELATVQEDVRVDYEWSQTWLGSTKTMRMRGVYKAKAGFNLRDPFKITVTGNKVSAILPLPRLLSVEMTDYKILQDDSGWWNSINSHDREAAIAAMQAEARNKALEKGLLEEAKARFRQQLEELFKSQQIAYPLESTFQGELPTPHPLEKP